MWRFSRNFVLSRWPKQQQNYVDNTKASTLPNPIYTFPSDERKKYSNQDQKKKKEFKDSERFWNCKYFRFQQLKSSVLEKAGWLSTVAIICFNIHLKHLQFILNHEVKKSHCLLSRNVLAVPKEVPPREIKKQNDLPIDNEEIYSKDLFASDLQSNKDEHPVNIDTLDELRKIGIQYSTAVHNLTGLRNFKNNAKKAFRHFQKAARLGSGQAFYNLALCYELGKGTQKDLTRAAFCYKKAAMIGHGLASFNLAVLFLKGLGGLPVDHNIAKQLLNQAAEKNVPEAQLYLGLDCLENKKYSEAFQMFNTLSENNVPDGKYYLGMCYENGWGVNKNDMMAADLFSQAATSGHSRSILKLSKFFEEGIGGCDFNLDFSMALCELLSNHKDSEKTISLLRLKMKKLILDKRTFDTMNHADSRKPMRSVSSVPELKTFQNKTCSLGILFSQSCLDLGGLLLPIKTEYNWSPKNMFYIDNNNYKFNTKFTVPSTSLFQFNVPQLMETKS